MRVVGGLQGLVTDFCIFVMHYLNPPGCVVDEQDNRVPLMRG